MSVVRDEGPAEIPIESRPDGLRWLVVKDGWSISHREIIEHGDAEGVELNTAKGSWGRNLGFLCEAVALKHLILIDLADPDVQRLQCLHNLESLVLSTYSTSALDFSNFPALREAFIEWRPRYTNLNTCEKLEDLYVNKYPAHDLAFVGALKSMSRLTIGDSHRITTLDGIQVMSRLDTLRLKALPMLSDISDIAAASETLEELTIRGCRHIGSVDALAKMLRLRRIVLEDCGRLRSLQPLAPLPALDELYFYGDTVIEDGRLDFLRERRFKSVSFQNRRHYSVRREDLSSFRA